MLEAYGVEDADAVLVATGTIATTAREVVRRRRAQGERVGLVKLKMIRPFPADRLREVCAGARRIGVLDRNYAAGTGGVFCHDVRAALQGYRDDVLVQGYLTGLCGGDVTPAVVDEVVDDLAARGRSGPPCWLGIDTSGEEAAS